IVVIIIRKTKSKRGNCDGKKSDHSHGFCHATPAFFSHLLSACLAVTICQVRPPCDRQLRLSGDPKLQTFPQQLRQLDDIGRTVEDVTAALQLKVHHKSTEGL